MDIDPLQCDLRDAGERAHLGRLLRQGLAQPAGFALPLRPGMPGEQRWVSSGWPIHHERLYLVPGTSPHGYRLPLDTLPEAPRGRLRAEDIDPGWVLDHWVDALGYGVSELQAPPARKIGRAHV